MKLFESSPVHIPVGTFRLELKGNEWLRVLAAGRACCEILNCDASQLDRLSTQFLSCIHADDRPSFKLALNHVLEGANQLCWEGRLRIEATNKFIRLDLDRIETGSRDVILEGVIQDLTEIKELEASFASVLDAAQAYTWRRDIKAGVSQFGVRWAEFAEHQADATSLTNDLWLRRVHPDDAADVCAKVQALEQGQTDHSTLLYRRQLEDKSWVWLRVHAGVSERDEVGTPTALSGVSFDVTSEMEERRRSEATNRELRGALSETQAALERAAFDLTEHIPIGTYTMVLNPGDELAKFGFMSRRFLEITGLEEAEARADPLRAFACVHPDDYEDWVKKNAHAFDHKTPFREETRLLVNGKVSWVVAESHPRQKEDGTWIWEGVIQDISEQKRAEEALQKANEQLVVSETLNARLEERQQLLQDIHDGFGNQLAIGKLRLSRGAASTSEAVQIVDDCLDDLRLVFATLDAEGESLWDVLSELRDRVEKRLRRFPIVLTWDIDAARHIVVEPRALLQAARIVQEAIANSLRHANAHALSIIVRCDKKAARITIQDDGNGFDVNNVTSGRGVPNMRRRARNQGWDLCITSADAGSCVTLTLN